MREGRKIGAALEVSREIPAYNLLHSLMRFPLTWFSAAVLFFPNAQAAAQANQANSGIEDAVFVYQLLSDNPDCPTIEQRLSQMTLRNTAIVSMEGGGFVLDRENGEQQVQCMLDALHRSGTAAKLMLLQDVSFLSNRPEALRRIRAVSAFAKKHGGLSGAVIDIEPHMDDGWSSGSVNTRRAIAARYLSLLRELRQASRPVPFYACVPWWFESPRDVPQLNAKHLSQAMDGVYVMVYGGAAGPHGIADDILKRVPPTGSFMKHGRVYLVLATEDEESPASMDRAIAHLRQQYRSSSSFAGTAVFHAKSPYRPPTQKPPSGGEKD